MRLSDNMVSSVKKDGIYYRQCNISRYPRLFIYEDCGVKAGHRPIIPYAEPIFPPFRSSSLAFFCNLVTDGRFLCSVSGGT